MSYKGFKKVRQDANTTTFQHPNGSELKISHKHLSPDLRKQLDALPMKMAEGSTDGPVSADDPNTFSFTGGDQPYTMPSAGDQPYGTPPTSGSAMSGMMPTANSGITVDTSPQVSVGNPQQQPVTPATGGAQPSDDDDDDDDAQSPSAGAPQAPAAQYPSGAGEDSGSAPAHPGDFLVKPMNADQVAQQGNQDYLATKQAFQNGQIKPETYEQLFAKKDTLGKIGTLFGLLLSGAGSGLAHQPNAVMEMMNKQIDRDLEAQKATRGNQLSFLTAADNHYRNLSEAALRGTQQAQMGAQTKLLGAQQKLTGAQTQEALENAKIAADTHAKNATMLAAVRKLQDDVSNIPPGPMRQAGDAALQTVSNGVDSHAAMLNAQMGKQFEQRWQAGNAAMNMLMPEVAKYQADRHIPGMMGQTSQPATEADRAQLQAMNVLDAKGRDVLNYIEQNKGISGALGVQTKNTAQQKLAELLSFYNQSVQGGQLTDGRRGWYDEQLGTNPTGFKNLILGGDTARLKEVVASNALRRNNLLTGKLGYVGPETEEQSQSNPQSQNSPSQPMVDKKGHQIVYIGGKPYRKKAQ